MGQLILTGFPNRPEAAVMIHEVFSQQDRRCSERLMNSGFCAPSIPFRSIRRLPTTFPPNSSARVLLIKKFENRGLPIERQPRTAHSAG